MSRIIGVTCPFTGKNDLVRPTWEWAIEIPGENVWYFPYDEDESVVMECVARAMGITEKFECVREAMDILIEQGNLTQVGEWYFLRLPEVPVFRPVNAAELIVAKRRGVTGQVELYEELNQRVGAYKHEIACAWVNC